MAVEIKNLKKAADRILKAVNSKEKIILYGDADLDGITSVIILKETINNLGGEVALIYFPDRENDGYGISKKSLDIFKNIAPALIIALDLGISNFEEIKLAKKLGFEVIVVDHHEVLDKIPDASIVVDPKQEGDKYPFKRFANVGIVFKLSQVLLGKNFSKNLKNNFLELTGLGTIADMMPETDENEFFIREGLQSLENTFRPGLKAFFEVFKDSPSRDIFDNSTRFIAQRIVSLLNAGERVDHLNETYLLLISPTIETAKDLVKILLEKSLQRKRRIKEITEKVEEKILNKSEEPIIFEEYSLLPLVLAGAVASRICQQYEKPTFIFKRGKEEGCGSVRNAKDVNSVEAMKSCSALLITFGGHAQASGFRIKNENLEKFKSCLIKYFKKT